MNGTLAALREKLDVESYGKTWVRYWSNDPTSENPPLLHWLSEQQVDVVTLSEVPRSLEEVYLRVVEQPIGQGS
jgi:ABC-2 type transport system ATP-binding protein